MNKKFALLLVLLAALALGLATSASAAEIKATGSWQIDAQWINNFDFQKKGADTEDRAMDISQRVRTAFEFIANENLKGVLETQIGPANWGNGLFSVGAGRGAGGNAIAAGPGNSGNAGAGNIMLRKGYVDFRWPGTKTNFLVGFQTVNLPSAVGGGSPILDDQAAAAIVSTPITDNVRLLAGFSRLVNSDVGTTASTGAFQNGSKTTGDVVFAAVPVDFKGINITPFAAYAYLGNDAAADGTGAGGLNGFMGPNSSINEGVRAYWGGVAFTMTLFDPFKIMADFNYGKATWNNQGANNKAGGGRSGWLADLAIDYTGLSMMTPSLFAAYSSGEKGNSTQESQSGRMPVVASPQNYALGSFFLGGGDTISGTIGTPDVNMGYWAVGLSLKDIKLIDKLSHTVHLMYIKGTNDVDYLKENAGTGGTVRNANYGSFLTTKDSLWEFDLNTKYQIYDELTVGLELGYINADFDKTTWRGTNVDYDTYGSADAYKAAMFVQYNF